MDAPPFRDPGPPAPPPGRVRRWLRGPEADPWWARPGLVGVTALSAVLLLWSLDASGYGNEYYAAAAYSGSLDWHAWLFGSLDTASFISVDKPPLSLWVSGLSVRVFGLSSWSVLVPHALAGVGTVLVLHRTVRRWHGPAAALAAAGLLAVTPVFVVMARYNNPDAILTLLLTSSAALAYSAARQGSVRRLAASGALVGLAFLTKTTQALLVVPAVAVVYLVAAPVPLRRRLAHGAAAAGAAVAAAGWWVVLAVAVPSAPFFGQTQNGGFGEYVFGINGLGRITGDGVGPGDPFGGTGGWARVFNGEVGGQVSWLIPLAAASLVLGLWSARRAPRTDGERAGWLMWGTFFAVQMATFSLMEGVFHPYYVMTLAAPVAALAGAGVVEWWRAAARSAAAAWAFGLAVAGTGVWSAVVLGRTPDFAPGLGTVIVAAAVLAGLAIPLVRARPAAGWHRWAAAAAVGAVLVAGPVSFALASIGTDYSGGNPKAGPGETGRPVPAAPAARPGEEAPPMGEGRPRPGGGAGAPDRPGAAPSGGPQDDAGRGGQRLALLARFLVDAHDGETWIAAAVGSGTASALILETGEAVMAMGGFSGGDPAPTTEELEGYLDSGALRFVLLSPSRGRAEGWAQVVAGRCSVVPPAAYGGGVGAALYDCDPPAAVPGGG
ncbi:MAG: glycosyltransferase family 39 protein [Actinobacteria bacterium]|nr:glycosyltransferase family 39 protein [Actinomycetota bacterium]